MLLALEINLEEVINVDSESSNENLQIQTDNTSVNTYIGQLNTNWFEELIGKYIFLCFIFFS